MLRQSIRRLVGSRLLNARFLFGAPLAYRPGHFYSPICDPAELQLRYRDPNLEPFPVDLPGITLGHDAQVTLWESWRPFLTTRTGKSPWRRYNPSSRSFGIGDATIYACMLRHLKPTRLIEVGSGSSSAVALDTFDQWFATPPRASFIEPYPALLRSLLVPEDDIEIIATGVQDVPPAYFAELDCNDLLFIDSTHIVKTGSDVVYELFEILPRLLNAPV